MKYRFFHIPALNPDAETERLNQLCARHRIIAVDKQFVANGADSFWALSVTYGETEEKAVRKKPDIDYREVLDAADFAVYAKLRSLRKKLAEAEGTPAYLVFTNAQLAEMVTGRVTTVAALGRIAGVGPGKCEKYGRPFLAALKDALENREDERGPANPG